MKNDIQAHYICDNRLLLTPLKIGGNGVTDEKTEYREKNSNFFFLARRSSPKEHPGDLKLCAYVKDYKNLDLEGSFDLLALPQPRERLS